MDAKSMSRKTMTGPQEALPADLQAMVDVSQQHPEGALKLLELARVLQRRGQLHAAAALEQYIWQQGDPAVQHEWRFDQAERAPANQFLLLNDQARTQAFARALQAKLEPGMHVLEIGTGSGLLALLAAAAGAARVTTCERQPLMAAVAQDIVRRNGLDGVITVLDKPLAKLRAGVDVPRPVDVLMADLFTGSLLGAGGLSSMASAHAEWLRPGGAVIPAAAAIRACLVGGSALEALCRVDHVAGFDLDPFNRFSPPLLILSPERHAILKYDTYTDPFECFRFDFQTLAGFAPAERRIDVSVQRGGRVLGLLQWVWLVLSPDNEMEAHPHSSLQWMRYLHVFPEPRHVEAGDMLRLHARHDQQRFTVWPLD